jgi:mono/diheme cytochrome c family protein
VVARKSPVVVASGRHRRGSQRLGQALAWLLLSLTMISCAIPPASQTTAARPLTPIAPAASPEAHEAGAQLYRQYCAVCHGDEGRSSLAAPLDQHGHAWHHPDSILIQTIREGTTRTVELGMPEVPMPPFGTLLTLEKIHTLIAFFKASWTPEQQRLQWERTERADLHSP